MNLVYRSRPRKLMSKNNIQMLFHYHDDSSLIEVKQKNHSRWLDTGSDCLQSAIDVRHPDNLILNYQAPLLGIQAFVPKECENILLLGLGGGSLAYQLELRFPDSKLTVIDIEPMMLEVAKEYFSYTPKDSTEFVFEEAYEYLKDCPKYDLILIDLYHSTALPQSMLNPTFYRAVQSALTERGAASFNLVCESQEQFVVLLTWIRHAFNNKTLFQGIGSSKNVVIYALNYPKWEARFNQLVRHKLFYKPVQTKLLGFYIEKMARDFDKKLLKLQADQ